MSTCIYGGNYFKNVYYLSYEKLIFCNKEVYDVLFFSHNFLHAVFTLIET